MDSNLNSDLILRSLNFHGQQLQKLWEGERGEQDLAKRNVKDPDFLVYAQRQSHLSFQDRGKRLKLQQFIAKKADTLFSNDLSEDNTQLEVPSTDDIYAVMPPLEVYLNIDKQNRLRYFFQQVKKGDYILGTIANKTPSGMMLKVLCTLGPRMRYVADINVKAACPTANIIPAVDKKGVSRGYMMNDSVCCEVIEVVPDCDKMVCGMKGISPAPVGSPPLGLVASDDFPLLYKKALDTKAETFEAVLEKSVGFNNPNNINYLSGLLGLGENQPQSNMAGLRSRFPQQEYASELRQTQASAWAFRSVADGIKHFKEGRHTEAFQCLNKALKIDPRNVEGLVARGALYANSGNFQKAIEEFETALKLNPSHANARKYMGETLVALGRSYEEEGKIDEARKAYHNCLSIIPFHEEAQHSLEFLQNKNNTNKNVLGSDDLLLPNLTKSAAAPIVPNSTAASANEQLKQFLRNEEEEKKEKKKKKKSKRKRKHHSSSSSSSSGSSGSSRSSSSSSSSSSDSSSGSSDSDSKSKKKKRKSRKERHEKQKSLSPLSKRMAHDTPTSFQFNKPAASASFDFGFEQAIPETPAKSVNKEIEFNAKLRSFFETHNASDSDYEERVRKFMQEASRWKGEKKSSEEKKKKKKKEKKSKKDSKKKRKDKKLKAQQKELELRDALRKELGITSKEKKKSKRASDDDEYLLRKAGISKRLLDSLPDLDELETKLSAFYAIEKAEKGKQRSNSSSPIQRFETSPSPTREQKARQTVAEVTAIAPPATFPKWRMQMPTNTAAPSNSRFKKKNDRDDWEEENKPAPKEPAPKLGPSAEEKAISIRKAMALKEPPQKKEQESSSSRRQRQISPPQKLPPPKQHVNQTGPVVLDKFGNFRIASPTTAKKLQHDEDMPPLPPGAPPPQNIQFPKKSTRPPEPPGHPRSHSRSPGRKRRSPGSRSRSRSSNSRSSRSRSRSRRSYRSRSRSYGSRSRSRSGSRSYTRSRSRSRSRSRYYDRRGGYRGRFNDRGTYYKPRFQNYKNNPRGFNNRGGNRYRDYRDRDGRDDRYYDRNRGGRGGGYRNYNNNGNNNRNRRPWGRFARGGYRDDRHRRRSYSRSVSRDRSYTPDSDKDVMTKVNQEKDKINKYIDSSEAPPPTKHDGPLSEGEDRDDYNSDKMVDRQQYEGKWADKEDESSKPPEPPEPEPKSVRDESSSNKESKIPSETNIEEMDKFLTKA